MATFIHLDPLSVEERGAVTHFVLFVLWMPAVLPRRGNKGGLLVLLSAEPVKRVTHCSKLLA